MFSNFLSLILIGFVFSVESSDDLYQEVKNSRNFTDKVVLVTGSSSGIGEQTVKLFSALGANVVITGRKLNDIIKVGEEVQKLSPKGLKPLEVVADLTKFEDIELLINQTVKQFGKIDVLVNDAGIFVPANITSHEFFKGLENSLNIDLRAPLQLIRLALPSLEKTKGSIINIASIFTEVPQRFFLAYDVSKQALKTSTAVLAQELGPLGIRVNTISPGVILNKALDQIPKELLGLFENTAKTAPLKRYGLTEDIAKTVVFLASSDAKYITGINIDVDGGLRLNISGSFASS